MKLFGDFVICELLSAGINDSTNLKFGLCNNESMHSLAKNRARLCNDSNFDYIAIRKDDIFDFRCGYFVSAAVDDVFDSIDNLEEATFVLSTKIAGLPVSANLLSGGGPGVVPVPADHQRA